MPFFSKLISLQPSFRPSQVQYLSRKAGFNQSFQSHWFVWFHQSQFVYQRKSCVNVRRWQQFCSVAEIEGARVVGIEDSRLSLFKVQSCFFDCKLRLCGSGTGCMVNSRETLIISNQRAAFMSLPSTAFKIPLSGRGVALGGRLRIFSSICRISEKRSPWLA